MRIKFPAKQRTDSSSEESTIFETRVFRLSVAFLLLGITFVSGFIFHRNGYAHLILDYLDTAEDEIRQEIADELILYTPNGLKTIYLDIPFDSMQTIAEKREVALATGILLASDEDYVPADLRFDGQQSMNIKIRLKGDWTDHLEGEKWSFRIHLDDEQGNVLGMRRFSLQAPETRNFVHEWALHQHFLEEGILTTRYSFVNVLINGELMGIYALEEAFSTELIESQRRREGVIIRFDEDILWENRANVGEENLANNYAFLITDAETADVTLFREGRVINDADLSDEASAAITMLSAFQAGELRVSEVFDVELFGKFFAITDLWAGNHGTAWHNMRYYYNPVTGLLEPIGFDNDPAQYPVIQLASVFAESEVFGDPEVREAYARELDRISRNDYLESFWSEIAVTHDAFVISIQKEYGTSFTKYSSRDFLFHNAELIQANLHPITPAYGSYQFIPGIAGANYLQVNLYNSCILPMELTSIVVEGVEVSFTDVFPAENTQLARVDPFPLLNFYSERIIEPDQFRIEIPFETGSFAEELDIHVTVRIAGLVDDEAKYEIQLTPEWIDPSLTSGLMPLQPDLATVLADHPFLELSEDGRDLFTLSGEWNVHGDLVLPDKYGLLVSPGTTLLFEEEAILYSNGAPVHIQGMQEFPVIIDAQTESWGGVIVLNAEQTSIWRWVVVDNTAAIQRDGWIVTGGITFYKSPIQLVQSYISSSSAEDAINVISSDFYFEQSVFAFTPSDAFDGDFSAGMIRDCVFHDIAGDALDFSGSQVSMSDVTILDVRDKAISAGERSTLEVDGLDIARVGIGVASKDLSFVLVEDGSITDVAIAGLAAYTKKPQYGPATIQANNIIIKNSPASICQTGSTILIDGRKVRAQVLDVDRLYELGILGN